jgi:type II secretory pathway pseudopilin PulG
MIGVIVIALMSALFAYFSINQKAKEWKLAFFLLSIIMMYVTLVLAIEELPLTNQTITSAVYDSGTSTYNFTYSNVTDTTPQVNTLAAMLSPVTWLIYMILGFTLLELLVNLIQFMRKGWV